MKFIIRFCLAIVLTIVAFGFTNRNDMSKEHPKKWVISPRIMKLQEGITKEEARRWLEDEFMPIYLEFPGFNAMLGEELVHSPNHTSTNGDFIMFYLFDSMEAYDRYFPNGKWSDEVLTGISKHQETFDKFFGKYFIKEEYQVEEYIMYASAK